MRDKFISKNDEILYDLVGFNQFFFTIQILNYYSAKLKMSGARIWQKKDLFNLSYQMEKKENKMKEEEAIKKQSLKHHMKKQQKIAEQKFQPIDPVKALQIQAKSSAQKKHLDDELKEMFQQMNRTKSTQQVDSQEKPISKKRLFFTPRCMSKNPEPKTQPPVQLTIRQQQKAERKQKWQFWKMREELKKSFKFDEENNQKKEEGELPLQNEVNPESNKTPEKAEKIEEREEESVSLEKQKRKAKTTQNKKKKIKKEENLVRQNLKRKYKDRFVGALNRNIKAIQRTNKMKRRGYYKPQVQITQGQLYNTYINSLSKALYITFSLDDEDSNEEEIQSKPSYTIPTTYTRQNLSQLIHDLFGFEKFREGQYETIANILNGQSTLFVSETASGKSLTYILASVIQKGLGIVISPLVSLMLDQLEHLPTDLPAACLSSLLTYDQKKRIIEMVKVGKIQLLFVTPQTFLTDFMYHIKQFPKIDFVCVDEAHSLSELSHSFRASYLCLEDIILKYFKYKKDKPVILCLTATANQQTMASICEKLKIKNVIKSKTTINKNLFITVSREEGSGKYEALLKYLQQRSISRLKGVLIYCRTKKIMFQAYNYLRNSCIACHIYHSGLEQKQKVEVMSRFREGKIRIVIATIALGMGLDFGNLECVVHINMPKSIQNYVQQIGRAGRRDRRAYCHLFLDKNDYYVERNYFLADELEMNIYEKLLFEIRKKTKLSGMKERRKSKKKDEFKRETQSLKRLSLNENSDDEYSNQEKGEIFYEDEAQDLEVEKEEEEIKVPIEDYIRNMVENNNDDEGEDEGFRQISYCKSSQLTEITEMSQQSILNIFLKVQKMVGKRAFRVLPLSHESVKIGFFKKNKQEIEENSQIFTKIIEDTRQFKGMLYIPLIEKCNLLHLTPIQLLTQIYTLSNKYTLRVELINQIFVWQTTQETLRQLESKQLIKKVIHEFNIIQRTALTKFNIFYSVCFNNAQKNLINMINNKEIISLSQPLPEKQIVNDFDAYFKEETYDFYRKIKAEAVCGEIQENEEAAYLPITEITQESRQDIRNSVYLFLKNTINACREKKFTENIQPYRDGRTITRIFMGVNDSKSSWKIYGQHTYWSKFKDKDYRKLLKVVKESVFEFITEEGPIYLQEQKPSKSYKKNPTKPQQIHEKPQMPQPQGKIDEQIQIVEQPQNSSNVEQKII